MANFNAVLYCRWSMASHTGFSFLSDIPDLVAISTQLGIPLQCPPVNHKRCNVQDTKNHIPHAKYKRKQSTKGVKMQHSKLYSTSHHPFQISDCPETLIPKTHEIHTANLLFPIQTIHPSTQLANSSNPPQNYRAMNLHSEVNYNINSIETMSCYIRILYMTSQSTSPFFQFYRQTSKQP